MIKNPFQDRMERHLVAFKDQNQYLPSHNKKKQWYYQDLQDNLFPPIRHSFLQFMYDKSIPLHDYANHVRSSQIFGVNLLYTVLVNEPKVIEVLVTKKLGVTGWSLNEFLFEYSPETDLLGEWKSEERPDEYVTSSDAALIFKDGNGERNIVLIEIKFTENTFGGCNGYTSNGNRHKVDCEDRMMIFNDINACYLQKPAKGRSGRTYLNNFNDLRLDFPGALVEQMCPFITNHQCLRNHSFIHALKANGFASAYFGLLYHDDNDSILREWEKYYNLASVSLQNELFAIKASELVSASSDANYKQYFTDRYQIG